MPWGERNGPYRWRGGPDQLVRATMHQAELMQDLAHPRRWKAQRGASPPATAITDRTRSGSVTSSARPATLASPSHAGDPPSRCAGRIGDPGASRELCGPPTCRRTTGRRRRKSSRYHSRVGSRHGGACQDLVGVGIEALPHLSGQVRSGGLHLRPPGHDISPRSVTPRPDGGSRRPRRGRPGWWCRPGRAPRPHRAAGDA